MTTHNTHPHTHIPLPSEATLYVTKKVIVAEISSAFHDVMQQFECTRLVKEKKRIGSDMTNVAIGHMIRGRFCSALARLILDGLKPYRMEGLVVDDIWRVTVAFCNEGGWRHWSHDMCDMCMDVSSFQDGLGMRLVFIHVNSLCISSLTLLHSTRQP